MEPERAVGARAKAHLERVNSGTPRATRDEARR
eukprot:CAMPEP_0118966632 /NCGR_PEP_ID=MMETSP1173-20130426/4086_1 /TAXON_ID=1034831 /ORGANISM="Rhizochromulina marina cf, Strain CCMP1243" /LENGTH=32 /DNA_ID= /DNA_START= /DNA_END= /DNA_ORIENTATION=